MFKSTFAKYVIAFAAILIISFVALSGIVTTTIRSYIVEENSVMLEKTALAVGNHISRTLYVEDLEAHVASGVASMTLAPLINKEEKLNIILTDANGKILLTTLGAQNTPGGKMPLTGGNLGKLDISMLKSYKNANEESFLSFDGELSSLVSGEIHLIAKEIATKNVIRGYAVAFTDSESEAALYTNVRRGIINSSLWVLLAAVVAVYFITERIIQPLKNMTKAAKSFAGGDFSTRVTVYGHDEVSELAEAFNNMAESLDSFEKMRNSFLANVSHDLRTPMTTIAGFIDGITSGAIPEEKHEYYLEVISREVHRLSRLVSDLLDISRLESGERKFKHECFDVAEVARIILISFEKKIEEKHLDIIFESESDELFVFADKDAIHQVLYNLCHNAIKFSREGGKLAISLQRIENKKIRISVYDEGQSIDREELPLVFDRFYKTDKSRGIDKNGVGLGLYICKTIIDAHGETIRAEAPSENSAEFWFTLKECDSTSKRKAALSELHRN